MCVFPFLPQHLKYDAQIFAVASSLQKTNNEWKPYTSRVLNLQRIPNNLNTQRESVAVKYLLRNLRTKEKYMFVVH
jgi:hypothetical protein